ncbi:MAG: hypothetical protein FWF56_05545 [Firmicutes bacterium]|nr:hypothetical protein [Bacillota bacterium]MCL1953521.1 hypothetical protein [Bacillota bacterium]
MSYLVFYVVLRGGASLVAKDESRHTISFATKNGWTPPNPVVATVGQLIPQIEGGVSQDLDNVFCGYFSENNGNGILYYGNNVESSGTVQNIARLKVFDENKDITLYPY